MNSVIRVFSFRLCFWNLNGVRNKFMTNKIKDLLGDKDMLVILETHFNIRSKCPDGFTLIARSMTIDSKKDRGGVAIYKKNACNIDFVVLHKNFPDCVVCEIKYTGIVIIALYIPPSNSTYYKDNYFDTLNILIGN